MKGLLLITGAVLGLTGKVASIALAIALILWLIVLFATIGLYTTSAVLFVIAESQD